MKNPLAKCLAEGKGFLRVLHLLNVGYAPTLSENHNAFLRLLKKKGFKEERVTKVGLDYIGTSTTLESNKSLSQFPRAP
jgi:hypothetical protein